VLDPEDAPTARLQHRFNIQSCPFNPPLPLKGLSFLKHDVPVVIENNLRRCSHHDLRDSQKLLNEAAGGEIHTTA
jgi:hypothetical protein